MTTNDHEAGKVSDERLVDIARGLFHGGSYADLDEQMAMATELRTRRAESQTGAVRVKALEWAEPSGHGVNPYYWVVCATTSTKNYRIDWGGYGLGHTNHNGPFKLMGVGLFPTIEAAKAAAQADYEQRIRAALEPTPIKETAEPEHIATDVHSETANAEHDPAVPADVQGVTGALIDAGAHALDKGTDLALPWEELCTLSELVLNAALASLTTPPTEQGET